MYNKIMKKRIKLIITISLPISLFIGLSLFITQRNHKNNSNQVIIAATIQPISSIAEKITNSTNIQVINIIPPSSNPHSFEPTIDNKITLQNANLIFTIGLDFDSWIVNIAPNAKIIDLSQNIQIKNNNPHYWLSLKNSKQIAFEIKNNLEKLDQKNYQIYETNYKDFTQEVDLLIDNYKIKFSTLKQKNVITYHPAFNYLFDDFNLNLITTIIKDEQSELSPQKLIEVKKLQEQYLIKTIYVSNQTPEYTKSSLEEKLNTKIVELDPLGNLEGNKDYLNLIQYNLDKILKNNE